MMRLTALFGAVLLTAAAYRGDDDASKADLMRLQGKWKPVTIVNNGKPEEVSAKTIFNFEGNKNVYGGEGAYDLITLNAKTTPKELTFDIIQKNGDVRVKGVKAIYAFDGDTLKICVAVDPKAERPKAFESKEKSGTRLIVLEKAK
jgi:uncharacterized protein (TIGR03067 family)